MSIILIDLDLFKKINDTFGHDAGDYVLIEVSKIMTDITPEGCELFRLGGEEFAILLPNVNTLQANDIAERLLSILRAKTLIFFDERRFIEQKIKVTASIGISEKDAKEDNINVMLKQADNYLYQAKHNGRNCIVYY